SFCFARQTKIKTCNQGCVGELAGGVGLSGETSPLSEVMNRLASPSSATANIRTASHFRVIIVLSRLRCQDLDLCSGFPFCLVEAVFSSSFSLIDLAISLDAPRSSLLALSPRLAAKAAPAACCCALDFAGIFTSCDGWLRLGYGFPAAARVRWGWPDRSGARRWDCRNRNPSAGRPVAAGAGCPVH